MCLLPFLGGDWQLRICLFRFKTCLDVSHFPPWVSHLRIGYLAPWLLLLHLQDLAWKVIAYKVFIVAKCIISCRFYDSLLDECLGMTDEDFDIKDDTKELMKEKGIRVEMGKKQVANKEELKSEDFKTCLRIQTL